MIRIAIDRKTVAPIFAKAGGLVLGPPLRPGTGALVREMMHYHRLVALFIPPSIAEQLLQEPGGLDNFRNLDWLAYTGGPLSPSAGEAISQVIDYLSVFRGNRDVTTPTTCPTTRRLGLH